MEAYDEYVEAGGRALHEARAKVRELEDQKLEALEKLAEMVAKMAPVSNVPPKVIVLKRDFGDAMVNDERDGPMVLIRVIPEYKNWRVQMADVVASDGVDEHGRTVFSVDAETERRYSIHHIEYQD